MKEFIFIVSWCLAITITDPCPDRNKTDEFGRKSNFSCAVYHYHIEYDCNHEKTFVDKDSALTFYNRVEKQIGEGGNFIFNSKVSSVKIDSTKQLNNF